MMAVAAALVFAASGAGAFSMGEVTATTGVQSTLAASGSTRPAGTIAAVKQSLGASVGTKQAQLDGAAAAPPRGWGGTGAGRGGWAMPGAGAKGWASGAATGGWASARAGGGWVSGGQVGGGVWASGNWDGGRVVN
jgi:hypothetical protein